VIGPAPKAFNSAAPNSSIKNIRAIPNPYLTVAIQLAMAPVLIFIAALFYGLSLYMFADLFNATVGGRIASVMVQGLLAAFAAFAVSLVPSFPIAYVYGKVSPLPALIRCLPVIGTQLGAMALYRHPLALVIHVFELFVFRALMVGGAWAAHRHLQSRELIRAALKK